ncbi:MAG: hypothetical protein K9L30_07480 [Desulfobacterales bacterium]|nr:hypothetical protein [Desulfobacterales bacterium]
MLRSVKGLYNYVLLAEDGEIGRCKDFLFDDRLWTIRYMVADTGKWLPGIKVLISPISLGDPDWQSRTFPIRLTKERIEGAPVLDSDAPVSRQHELNWTRYYGWPYYWVGRHPWGIATHPGLLYRNKISENEKSEPRSGNDNLRSANEVAGYHIKALDDAVGHVEDFILNDETWVIHYMVVDTRNWLPGRKVLIAPNWIDKVSWAKRDVRVDLTSEQIRNSPEYDPTMLVNREYEERMYDFYGRPKYWD